MIDSVCPSRYCVHIIEHVHRLLVYVRVPMDHECGTQFQSPPDCAHHQRARIVDVVERSLIPNLNTLIAVVNVRTQDFLNQ